MPTAISKYGIIAHVQAGTHVEPVAQDAHDAQCIRRRDNLVHLDALRSLDCVVPLRFNGVALEDVPEEEYDAPDCHDGERAPERVAVDLLDGEAE